MQKNPPEIYSTFRALKRRGDLNSTHTKLQCITPVFSSEISQNVQVWKVLLANGVQCRDLQELTRASELTKSNPSRETHLYLPSDTAINGNVIAKAINNKSWNLTTLQKTSYSEEKDRQT